MSYSDSGSRPIRNHKSHSMLRKRPLRVQQLISMGQIMRKQEQERRLQVNNYGTKEGH